jgi:spoIIIJ-associated protein
MEWVETTGKSIEEAKDAALDQLGVDEQDAEFEVIEEPRAGLFGRTRGEARVRARVRPTQPRPKLERRDRRQRGGGGGRQGDRRRSGSRPNGSGGDKAPATASGDGEGEAPAATATAQADRPPRSRRGGRGGDRGQHGRFNEREDEETIEMSEAELTEQGDIVRTFLVDLLDAFGLDGEVTASTDVDDMAVELDIQGDDLGLLIGPKGQTLQAIQELSRSALQRQKPGESHARVRIDVSGYRQRRKEALARFVTGIAEEVRDSGVQKALEPMSPPDRKVVHDTVNDIDGVTTVSEGEDSRRRVVILPG